jgi:hypothetical protein
MTSACGLLAVPSGVRCNAYVAAQPGCVEGPPVAKVVTPAARREAVTTLVERHEMGQRLQRQSCPFGVRLPDPCGLCRPTRRNGRSAQRNGSVPPIGHCSLRASAQLSPAGSGFSWMSAGGQSTVRLHPTMFQTHRERVAALIRALAKSEGMKAREWKRLGRRSGG